MKRSITAALILSTLLAACTPPDNTPPKVQDPAATAPTAPVAGQAQEITQLPVQAQSAALTIDSMTTPGPDMDPDLLALFTSLGLVRAQPLTMSISSPATLGKELARSLGRGPVGLQSIQVEPIRRQPMQTGTTTVSPSGVYSYSAQPTDKLIMDDQLRGFYMEVDWYAGGAPSVWVEHMEYGGIVQTEVFTKATGLLKRAGTLAAQATVSMTPGDCLFTTGPTALKFDGWAGKQTAPAAKAALDYAWTDAGIKFSASATYKTRSRTADMSAALDIRGTTANRCDLNTFSFTPTRMDASATVSVPNQTAESKVYLRDLGNLTISASAMKAQNPFQAIQGNVNASLTYDGKVAVTAFGPLADGSDLNMQPGDQVQVKYVKNGVLVETDLPTALGELQP